MEQATFSEWEHDTKKRRTRREKFLAKRDGLIPWGRLERRVERFYPKAGRGRRPYPLGTMLRVHCVQWFYNLSDPGMEDLLYEVESVRRFAGLRLTGPLPDETTILNFRHLLERHGLGETLFAEINAHLASLGQRLKTGTIVDASIIGRAEFDEEQAAGTGPGEAPDEEGQAMVFRQEGTHRGGLGVGLDARSGEACPREGGGRALRRRRRSARRRYGRSLPPRKRGVEHPFLYVKRHFGYGKVRYRGLAKNTQRIAMLLGFTNLLIAGRYATA